MLEEIIAGQDVGNVIQAQQTIDVIPSNWEAVRLGEVSNILMGQSPPSNTYNSDGLGLPFLQGKTEFTDLFPNPIKYCTSPLKIARKGSVLISVRAPVGDTNLADKDYVIGRGLASISLKSGDNWFLFYLLLYSKAKIETYGSGTTFQSINRTVLDNLCIPLPPLPQQHTIVKVLRTVHEAIQTRRDELKLENERHAALIEYLFTHGTRGEPTKQTEIGDTPEKWQVVELGEIITLHRGYDLPSKDRKPGIVPIISSSGISGTHSESKVTAPGVVTGRYGTIGEVFYVEQDFWPLNTTLYVSEFRRVTPHFVAYLLRTLNFNIFNDKSTVPGVNRNDLHRIKTVLPPPSEQQDIVDVLSAHDTKLSALEQETALLEELFNALLEELMTGRLSTLPLIEEGGTHE
jgi:type I restriction enzyme, S subunit